MPPKKRPSEGRGTEYDNVPKESIDDYLLPKTMIARLAKGVLPLNTQLQKDALTAILKSTTVFVNYLANNANDRAVLGNHKTIKPEDVFEALREMEFEHFIPRVHAEMDRYVEIQNTKRNDYRHRVKENPVPDVEGETGTGHEEGMTNDDMEDVIRPGNSEDGPAAKKARLSNGIAVGETSRDTEDDDEIDIPDDEEEEDYEEPMEEDEIEDEPEDDEPPEEFEDAVQDLDKNGGGDTESEEDD